MQRRSVFRISPPVSACKNIKVRTEIGTANDVGMEIVRIAEDEFADMIVIATHGMTGWRRIPFGSVAKKVVEEAKCPVLVLRAQETGHAGRNSSSHKFFQRRRLMVYCRSA